MTGSPRHTLVIGGGVIGIACAHYLADAGIRVTLVDKKRIGEACSYRNCGLVCPSHVLPLAMPGAIRSATKAMLSRGGAFKIRPRADLSLWRWLWSFARRCNRRDMLDAGRGIQALLKSSLSLYEDLLQTHPVDCEWRREGLLFVYRSQAAFDAYASEDELLAKEFDEGARRLSPDELSELEPSVKEGLAGGWYYEEDAHLRPEKLVHSWRAALEARGVRVVEDSAFEGFSEPGGDVSTARVAGESVAADSFVVATGAWTPLLEKLLGFRVPIEPGKGYSVMVPNPRTPPRIPMIFPEHRVVVTPFETGMRLGSIMEFAGWNEEISESRLKLLGDGARHYLRDPIPEPQSDSWCGWRPMTYDSKPVIGECPGFSNVFLATGHNMLGLSMATATGRLISELIRGVEPHLDPAPYAAGRFL